MGRALIQGERWGKKDKEGKDVLRGVNEGMRLLSKNGKKKNFSLGEDGGDRGGVIRGELDSTGASSGGKRN